MLPMVALRSFAYVLDNAMSASKSVFLPQRRQLHHHRKVVCVNGDSSNKHRYLHIVLLPLIGVIPDTVHKVWMPKTTFDNKQSPSNRFCNLIGLAISYVIVCSYMEKILDWPRKFLQFLPVRPGKKCNTLLLMHLNTQQINENPE